MIARSHFCNKTFARHLFAPLLLVLAALAVLTTPARPQTPSTESLLALPGPVIACPTWKPTWENETLPNGRAQPYVRVPLDNSAFSGNVLGPVLLQAQPPVIQLFLRDAQGTLRPLPVSREIAGPPYPAPESERVFWNEPPAGFTKGSQMVVMMQVRAVGSSRFNTYRTIVQDEWLRYDLSAGTPTIDRSALGPVETGGSANYVPKQQLLNGATASAFHGTIRIALPALSADPNSDQVYVRSDNLISTRNLDQSAGYKLAFGVIHHLPSRNLDIAPNDDGEVWVRSNQATTDQSVGLSLGTLALGPNWNAPIANKTIYAALTPHIQFNPVQFQYFFRRDLRLDPGFTEHGVYDPSIQVILTPFFLGLGRGQTATIERTSNLSFDAKAWYVTGLGTEYHYVVRLQVPMHLWILSAVGVSYFQGADETSYFRYSTGVGFDFSLRH